MILTSAIVTSTIITYIFCLIVKEEIRDEFEEKIKKLKEEINDQKI